MDIKRIFSLLVGMLIAVSIQAQNSIDKMVTQYQSVGGSVFTSAVQRNSKTRKVEKVVKRLEIDTPQAKKFVDAFKREARSHSNSTTKQQDGDLTIIITEENKSNNRIYMLKSEDNNTSAVVTIIIRLK